jgi:lysyl-tRNA synthetase class 2
MKNLQNYAKFLAKIREFFATQNIIEVDTNSLLNFPTLDENIDSIKVITNQKFTEKNYYLHTSPELEMKKLLANGSGDIYQICKVYRDNEIGLQNFNEFSMLEYYIVGTDEQTLSENVIKLLNFVGISGEVARFSYSEIFKKFANFDINSSFDELKDFAKSHNLTTDFEKLADLQTLLFVHFVEDNLKQFEICIIYDYPKSQSALAKVEGGVSKRFEIYLGGVEIANGYKELTTASEYRERFLGQSGAVNDEFLGAIKNSLNTSLPNCSGVAIGLGRVFKTF